MSFRFLYSRRFLSVLALVATGIAVGNLVGNGGRWRAQVGTCGNGLCETAEKGFKRSLFTIDAPADIGTFRDDGVKFIAGVIPNPSSTNGGINLVPMNADGTPGFPAEITYAPAAQNLVMGMPVALVSFGNLAGDGTKTLAVGGRANINAANSVNILFLNPQGVVQGGSIISPAAAHLTNPTSSLTFGEALADVGDLNGDGIEELAVGGSRSANGIDYAGAVWILFMNRDGTVQSSTEISAGNGSLQGSFNPRVSIVPLGNFFGDGKKVLAVVDTAQPTLATKEGLWILSLNANGSVASQRRTDLYDPTLPGYRPTDYPYGHKAGLANVGDWNGDGVADLAIGTGNDNNANGSAWIVTMNQDGTPRSAVRAGNGSTAFGVDTVVGNFGEILSTVGDLDGDGKKDIVIVEHGDSANCPTNGARGTPFWVLFSSKQNGCPADCSWCPGVTAVSSSSAPSTPNPNCCQQLGLPVLFHDALDGSTLGYRQRGEFTTMGGQTAFNPITGGYIRYDNPAQMINPQEGALCVTVWPKHGSNDPGQNGQDIFFNSGAGGGGTTFVTQGAEPNDILSFHGGGWNITSYWSFQAQSAWRTVTAKWGPSGKKLFVDNQEVASQTNSEALPLGSTITLAGVADVGGADLGFREFYVCGSLGGTQQSSSSSSSSSAPAGDMTWNAIGDMKFGGSPVLSAAYGNGKFVAVGYDGKGSYSLDGGVTWTTIGDMTFGTNNIYAVTYSNGKFVAVGAGGKGAYSSDGITWTAINDMKFGGGDIRAVTYGNNKFVAVGNNSKGAYSSDGITWIAVGDMKFGASHVLAVAYGNGKFIAVGNGGMGATSPDGITWTATNAISTGAGVWPLYSVVYGNGRFVTVGLGGGGATSVDGITWIPISDNLKFWETESHDDINAVAYGDGKFVAVGNRGKGSFSPDGITWTAVSDMRLTWADQSKHIFAIAFGGGNFVAGGNHGLGAYSGTPFTVSSSSSVASTPAGDMTWTAINDMNNIAGIDGIAFGNGRFVAGGVQGKGAYSLDGITWTAIADTKFNDPLFDTIHSVAYGNGKFVTVGYSGKGAYSLDGITWTAIADMKFVKTYEGNIFSVTYGNGKFVAVGENGKGSYSTDGITWTAIGDMKFGSTPVYNLTTPNQIYSVVFGNGKFIAVGPGGKGAYSTDGITWTAIADMKFSGGTINSVAYGNGLFVAGGGGKASYSADGITWTAVADTKISGTMTSIQAIAYGNGRFVATATFGKGAYSFDGITWTAIDDMKFSKNWLNGASAIAYGNGKFVAVGMYGEASYSGPSGASSSSDSSVPIASSASSISYPPAACANGIIEVGEQCEIGYSCLAGATCAFDCRCTGGASSSQASSGISTASSQPSSAVSSAASSVPVTSSAGSVLCGNGVIEGSEVCEANIPCSTGRYCSNCQCISPNFCGDDVVSTANGEECESDNDCPDGDFCTLNCLCHEDTGGNCGNGNLEAQEQCERNHPCGDDKQCQSCVCVDVPRCGNSSLERGEQCEVNDPCPSGSSCVNCLCQQSPGCGNGILGAGEQCEQDSHCASGQYCNRLSCRCEGASTESCGNGIVDGQEQCELGQPCQNSEEICDLANCSCVLDVVTTLCGNAAVDAGEDCDIGTPCGEGEICNFSGCHCIPWEQRCGDAELSGGEECEIGSPCGDAAKACDISQCMCANLSSDEVCGNGLVEVGEECEVGTACPFGWSCDFPHCRCLNQPVCGDATLNPGEQCEINAACSGTNQTCDFSRCRCAGNIIGCGNAVIDPGEQCDDGNRTDGDGCDATCRREWQTMVGGNATCGNGIVESGEQCDDGGREDSDGCSSLCQWEMSATPGIENPTWGIGDHAAGSQGEGGFLTQGGYTSDGVFIPGSMQGPGGTQAQGSNRGAQTIVFPGQQGWNTSGGQQQVFFPSYYGSAVPFGPTGGPVGNTGPAAVAVIAAGAAGGWAWMRRRRRE